MVGNRVDSAMAIYSEKEFAFDDKTKDLFANLADDLSRALVNIEVNEQRQRNAMQLKKLSSAVDQSADAIMILSSEGAIEVSIPNSSGSQGTVQVKFQAVDQRFCALMKMKCSVMSRC